MNLYAYNGTSMNSYTDGIDEIIRKEILISPGYSQDPAVKINSTIIENKVSVVSSSQSNNSGFIFEKNVKKTGCSVDDLRSNSNYTVLSGTNRNDLLLGAADPEEIFGKMGDDIIQSREGVDIIFGSGGEDKLQGGDASDSIFGEQNDDIIIGGNGDDYLCGGAGDDFLYAGPGDDILEGGRGADFFDCGDGIDIVLDFSLLESDIISNNCEIE